MWRGTAGRLAGHSRYGNGCHAHASGSNSGVHSSIVTQPGANTSRRLRYRLTRSRSGELRKRRVAHQINLSASRYPSNSIPAVTTDERQVVPRPSTTDGWRKFAASPIAVPFL